MQTSTMIGAGTLNKRTDERTVVLPFTGAVATLNDGKEEVVELLRRLVEQQQGIIDRLDRLEMLHVVSVEKENYLVEEAAKRTVYKAWTIRQWCNLGRVKAKKGSDGRWRIPHSELVLLQNEGPRPADRRAS